MFHCFTSTKLLKWNHKMIAASRTIRMTLKDVVKSEIPKIHSHIEFASHRLVRSAANFRVFKGSPFV